MPWFRKPRCPRCRGRLVRIVYGFVDADTHAAAERGEVLLGGSLTDPLQPNFRCADCGRGWRRDGGTLVHAP